MPFAAVSALVAIVVRKAISIVLRSRTYGDVGRRVLGIEEIRDRLAKTHGTPVQPKRVTYSV